MCFLTKYRIGSQIGKGYSGHVYTCVHGLSGKKFACKIIKGLQKIERNNNEVELLKRISHPGINPIKESFIAETKKNIMIKYVVSNLADGDLFGYTEKYMVDEKITKHFIYQMLQSVKYLHENHICHSDIKPENFLYFESPGIRSDNINDSNHDYKNVELKLIDFEFSKLTHENGLRQRLNGRAGTISFMAPEMVVKNNYTEKIDLWSIGVITYTMLYNRYPILYTNRNPPLSFNIHYPELKNKHVSDCSVDFMKQILVKDPNKRLSAEDAIKHDWFQA